MLLRRLRTHGRKHNRPEHDESEDTKTPANAIRHAYFDEPRWNKISRNDCKECKDYRFYLRSTIRSLPGSAKLFRLVWQLAVRGSVYHCCQKGCCIEDVICSSPTVVTIAAEGYVTETHSSRVELPTSQEKRFSPTDPLL